ncbi:hypothetical protein [Nocardia sp. BMG51109]|uniref:hypothetical protein n=1 Tax=Nocardia sp. BMG51109 TaxID=1056816 RepID=UPI0004B70F06|nr:hypothetical protein [Nocardia sp. BMG51109]
MGTIRSLLITMLAARAQDVSPIHTVHVWGFACSDLDAGEGREVGRIVLVPEQIGRTTPVLDWGEQLCRRMPGTWGFGFAYFGWVEAFDPEHPIPEDLRRAFDEGRMTERPEAEQVYAAHVFDARGMSYASYLPAHSSGLDVVTDDDDTRDRVDDMVALFRDGSLCAEVWATALTLDSAGNADVLERLLTIE